MVSGGGVYRLNQQFFWDMLLDGETRDAHVFTYHLQESQIASQGWPFGNGKIEKKRAIGQIAICICIEIGGPTTWTIDSMLRC